MRKSVKLMKKIKLNYIEIKTVHGLKFFNKPGVHFDDIVWRIYDCWIILVKN